MAWTPARTVNLVQTLVRSAQYTTLLRRPFAFKSAISLDTIYPKSSLKITTPSFVPNKNEKFSGYIPLQKLEITYSASSGPGGQNVNKVHTKVDMRFKLSEADWLDPEIKEKLLEKHSTKLTKEGYIVIRSDLTRSQQLNTADCLEKLRQMIWNATHTNKEPTPESLERVRKRQLKASRLRLSEKREASNRRSLTQPPTIHDL